MRGPLSFLFHMLTSWCGFLRGLFALLTHVKPCFSFYWWEELKERWGHEEIPPEELSRWLMMSKLQDGHPPGVGSARRGCRGHWWFYFPRSRDKLDSLKPRLVTAHLPAPFTSPPAALPSVPACFHPAQSGPNSRRSFDIAVYSTEIGYISFEHLSMWHIHMLLDIHFYQLF